MDLFEYIKSQLPQMPNVAIMKDLGASQGLIDYVKESPENTNLNVAGSISGSGEGGGGDAEVWASSDGAAELVLVITSSGISGSGSTSKTYDEWLDVIENHQNYEITAEFNPDLNVELEWREDEDYPAWDYAGGNQTASISEYEGEIGVDGTFEEPYTSVTISVKAK